MTADAAGAGARAAGSFADAASLLADIQNGEATARSALEFCLERISLFNGKVNAVVYLEMDKARAAADRRDGELRAGRRTGPLHGVPVTVKECFDWEGRPATWGDPSRRGNCAASNSAVVQKLEQAGAVLIGKTNISAYLGDWETWNPLFGGTRNPHGFSRSAGGSSGGSAAAVASGMSYADIGSDLGGSIRMPAHYCGVFGLKPSWGLISMRGHSPRGESREPDIGVAGPITRSARDAAAILSALAGPASSNSPWRLRLSNRRPRPLRNLKIAALLDHDLCPVDAGYLACLERFADSLSRAGAAVMRDTGPSIDLARHTEIMNLLVRAETSTKPSLNSGGRQSKEADRKVAKVFSKGVRLSHREWLELQEERHALARKWDRFFSGFDLLICPSGARTAPHFEIADGAASRKVEVNGARRPVVEQHFWFGFASLPGNPAVSVPVSQTDNGLPAGIQIIGPKYSDLDLCGIAGEIHALASQAGQIRGQP